jgi:hypothetical protein
VRTYDCKINLDDALGDTLEQMAMKHGLSPHKFVGEIVEAAIASYRLPSVTPSVFGPPDRFAEPRSPVRKSAECTGK